MIYMHVQSGHSWQMWKKKLGTSTMDFVGTHTTQHFTCCSCLCLTLISIKASEASVPLRVRVVRVEQKRKAATRGGEESGIYSGLKLLKFSFATQNGN